MSDIYQKAGWPDPSVNPAVLAYKRGDEWYSNEELVAVLGLTPRRALLSKGALFGHQIGDDDSALESRGVQYLGKSVNRAHGGMKRMFNRRAFLLAAWRTTTPNAAGFRYWLATQLMGGLDNG